MITHRPSLLFSPGPFNVAVGGVPTYSLALHHAFLSLGVGSAVIAGLHRCPSLNEIPHVVGRYSSDFKGRRQLNEAAYLALCASLRPKVRHDLFYERPLKGGFRAVTVYDLMHLRYPEVLKTAFRDTFKIAVESANCICCISNATRDALVEYLPRVESRVYVTPMGVQRTTDPLEEIRRDPSLILYVGRRSSYKNWQVLVDAMRDKRLSHTTLISVGGGALSSDERALLTNALGGRWRWVQASEAELDVLYRRAATLVVPSREEGFGLPILEAMSRGCPVIISRVPALLEAAGPTAVVFNADSAEDLAEAILVASDPCHRIATQEGRRQWTDEHSWDETARRTVAAYTSAGSDLSERCSAVGPYA